MFVHNSKTKIDCFSKPAGVNWFDLIFNLEFTHFFGLTYLRSV